MEPDNKFQDPYSTPTNPIKTGHQDPSTYNNARSTGQQHQERVYEDVESIEEYRRGGYHPVHLGDHLGASGRYRVLHKLGSGGFGTVWLCRDEKRESYVALKVIAADVRPDKIQDHVLAGLDRTIPGGEHITIPLDYFSTEGPNGTHQCIVLPVLGPCVSPRLWIRMKEDPAPVLRRIALQAVRALNFLHKNGFCHGDFRPANILVKLASLDHLSEEELLSLLGKPLTAQVRATKPGADLPPSMPRYLVYPADMSRLGDEYLTDQICVIDFGELFPVRSPRLDLGIPGNYLPPEVLVDEEDAIGPGCDLWALGCTLFEIRKQVPLFQAADDMDELLGEIVQLFGKLPAAWWDSWESRDQYFDEEGTWTGQCRPGEKGPRSLEALLSKPLEVIDETRADGIERKSKKKLTMSEAEQKLMVELLYKMFRHEPRSRPSIDDVLEHEWFKM